MSDPPGPRRSPSARTMTRAVEAKYRTPILPIAQNSLSESTMAGAMVPQAKRKYFDSWSPSPRTASGWISLITVGTRSLPQGYRNVSDRDSGITVVAVARRQAFLRSRATDTPNEVRTRASPASSLTTSVIEQRSTTPALRSNVEHRKTPSNLEPRVGWAMGNAGIIRELLRFARLERGGFPSYFVSWPDQPASGPLPFHPQRSHES
jgi:hypothetical protein